MPRIRQVTAIRNTLTAAIVGWTCILRPFQILPGKVCVRTPARNSEISNSSNEARKANSAADNTPGSAIGSTTRKKTRTRAAAEAERRTFQIRIDSGQGRQQDQQHDRHGDHRVAETRTRYIADQPKLPGEIVHRDRRDDARHDDRYQHQRRQQLLAAKLHMPHRLAPAPASGCAQADAATTTDRPGRASACVHRQAGRFVDPSRVKPGGELRQPAGHRVLAHNLLHAQQPLVHRIAPQRVIWA